MGVNGCDLCYRSLYVSILMKPKVKIIDSKGVHKLQSVLKNPSPKIKQLKCLKKHKV